MYVEDIVLEGQVFLLIPSSTNKSSRKGCETRTSDVRHSLRWWVCAVSAEFTNGGGGGARSMGSVQLAGTHAETLAQARRVVLNSAGPHTDWHSPRTHGVKDCQPSRLINTHMKKFGRDHPDAFAFCKWCRGGGRIHMITIHTSVLQVCVCVVNPDETQSARYTAKPTSARRITRQSDLSRSLLKESFGTCLQRIFLF